MEKTYKFALPKNQEVESTNVRVENGAMFVYVKFKEKFQPKDGDFLVNSIGKVFIYSDKPSADPKGLSAYCGEHKSGNIIARFSDYWTLNSFVRFASPDEKAEFLERLEKECGKRWNPETKTLEPIRWRANRNEYYYAMTPDFTVAKYMEEYSVFDEGRYNACNYFKTPKEAQPYADKVKEMFKNA